MSIGHILAGTGSGGYGTAIVSLSVTFRVPGAPDQVIALPDIINRNSPLEQHIIALASGENTITVVSIAGGVIFIPPAANTSTVFKLKTVSGDATFYTLSPRAPSMLLFSSTPPSQLFIHASEATSQTRFIFF